ncbi:MAG: DoxX family protein [Rhodobacteraceae bacterium]|nr:MAG: DoxX family protein [Paracoccaceae bacterium]
MSGTLVAAAPRFPHRASLSATGAPRSTVLIRAAIGLAVFVPEGVRKFIFPDFLCAGRLAAIGMPSPGVARLSVGFLELLCGALIAPGRHTRLASMPLIAVTLVALVSTKAAILVGADAWLFRFTDGMGRTGFWPAQHAARIDMAMLPGLLFLSIAGAGPWPMDAAIARRHAMQRRTQTE